MRAGHRGQARAKGMAIEKRTRLLEDPRNVHSELDAPIIQSSVAILANVLNCLLRRHAAVHAEKRDQHGRTFGHKEPSAPQRLAVQKRTMELTAAGSTAIA